MTRSQTIALIHATLEELPDTDVNAVAEITTRFANSTIINDTETLAAIAEGIEQADRKEFASEAEVEAAFALFQS